MMQFRKVKITQNRVEMLRGSFLLTVVSILEVMLDWVLIYCRGVDLESTGIEEFISRNQNELIPTVIMNSLAFFAPFICIIYFWTTSVFDKSSPLTIFSENRLYSLHHWTLIAAFIALAGSPGCILFLAAAVFVGTTIQPTNEESKLFFATTSSQKPDFTF